MIFFKKKRVFSIKINMSLLFGHIVFFLVAVALLSKANSFKLLSSRFIHAKLSYQVLISTSSCLFSSNSYYNDNNQPISIQQDSKRFSTTIIPFLATLLTSTLLVKKANIAHAADFLKEPTPEFKDEEKKVSK